MRNDDEVVAAIVGGITARTRLLLLSHITSPSGLILPALRIVREGVARARELGNERFEVGVVGAHAPGYMELSVRELAWPRLYPGFLLSVTSARRSLED
jgi:isopenicillin-N epimerase